VMQWCVVGLQIVVVRAVRVCVAFERKAMKTSSMRCERARCGTVSRAEVGRWTTHLCFLGRSQGGDANVPQTLPSEAWGGEGEVGWCVNVR
jgi:hypothetical protein